MGKTRATADPWALLRAMRGDMSQISAAERLGISQPKISEIERGRIQRSADYMREFVEGYCAILHTRLLDAGGDWRWEAAQVCAVARLPPPRRADTVGDVVEMIGQRALEALGVSDGDA